MIQLILNAATAMAQATEVAPAKSPSLVEMLAMPVGFLFIMYFLIIRPQQKKAKEHADLLTNLKAGDEVVTSGGIIGKVRAVAESFVTIEVANNTAIKVMKSNVSGLTKQPTAKDAVKA
ncbi:MAG: preprotein translocase subunit YajC [Deltaproteobacteria bacterium]|nr:preprotein translocase subunit YajC [Deltaproteobacteria bacterium]